MADHPIEATVFAYHVGFGDCFLLRFTYADGDRRHILIDFGTMSSPEDAKPDWMRSIARDIRDKCTENGGALNIVVATHRHADHISGFTTAADGKGTGDIIAALKPRLVVQPWTEAPNAPVRWHGPVVKDADAFTSRRASLDAMHETAGLALQSVYRSRKRLPAGLVNEIAFVGEDNLKNLSAIKNLQTMGPNVYVYHGSKSGMAAELPAIDVTVLGPPTLTQTDKIKKQASSNRDEFWMLAPKRMSDAGGLGDATPLFPGAKTIRASRLFTEQRWLARRVDQAANELTLSLVRALDSQMNNTSVILLFRAGNKSLLFPGDAQLENWQYALQSKLAPLLDDVDLYKVGHHGSRNATPRSMWKRFTKRGDRNRADRLTSVMSTKHGKHGCVKKHTEVPRISLVDALTAESNLHSTESLAPGELYEEISVPLT
jgi:hypothetical protein